jgi:hypothetical protein
MDAVRRRTLGLLLAGLLLATGTPGFLALARPGLKLYLLHPVIFLGQAVPYLLAGALWLPCRSQPRTTIGRWLAGLLLLTAGVLYLPMLTGLLPMGGDMVGLLFITISAVTALAVLLVSGIAHGLISLRRSGESK